MQPALDSADRAGASSTQRLARSVAAYAVLVGLPAALVLLVLHAGAGLPAATGVAAPAAASGSSAFDLGRLVAQIVVIVGAARLLGALARRVGQPRVVGEMAAGLLLGPSALGLAAPGVARALFPPESLGFVNSLAQVGVLLFMFVVGIDLDLAELRRRGHAALVTSHASIIAPLLLGSALALLLYGRYAPAGVPFASFALFMGAAMSVTAFPVLARILEERGMTGSPLGIVAIACAAIDDVTAWCILAAVVLVARAEGAAPLLATLAGTAAYLVVMFTAGRALLARLAARAARDEAGIEGFLAVVMLLALGSAWVTEWIGVHALFGAFLVGALLPKSSPAVAALTSRLRDLMVVLLLPLFFAFTGLRTTLTLISGAQAWALCLLVLLVAVAGKLGGSALAARVSGMSWRDALSLGALMNTRGLMELVILNVGLDIGVLSPPLFAMMVVMALVTTALTTPLLNSLQDGRKIAHAR